MDFKKIINNYGLDCLDVETSPFEALNMLHNRSYLQKNIHLLDFEEKMLLFEKDLSLILNSQEMHKHISKIYDFSRSKEPMSEWWWHLDLVVSEKINFDLVASYSDGEKK